MSYPFDPYESLALCSGQCQASRFPPVNCRCVCGGRNHGILFRQGRVIDVRQAKTHDQQFREFMGFEEPKRIAPLPLLPHIQPKPIPVVRKPNPRETDLLPVGRAAKSFLKKITGYRSQDDLNFSIIKGLRVQLSQENTDKVIDQAFTIRQSRQPNANRPELYELYETGEIDEALELMGKRWVIGRPKLRR